MKKYIILLSPIVLFVPGLIAVECCKVLIEKADRFDMDTVGEDVRMRRVDLDDELVKIGVTKTLIGALEEKNAAILKISYPDIPDLGDMGERDVRDIGRYEGKPINLLRFSHKAFARGGREFKVLRAYHGDVPEHIVILLSEGKDYIDRIYNVPKVPGLEMIVAVVPFEGDDELGRHPLLYRLRGIGLFSSIVVDWPERFDFSPRFSNVFSEDSAEALVERIVGGNSDGTNGRSE